jgi:hypothetical protein
MPTGRKMAARLGKIPTDLPQIGPSDALVSRLR